MKTGPRVSELATPLVRSCMTCGALLDGEHLEESVDGVRCEFCGALQEWATDEGPHAPAPVGVGDTLCKAREARKESLEHAASETHIHERFFLRGYAEHLELDEGPLLEAYDLAAREEDSALVIDGALPKDHSRGNRLVTAIATIAVLMVAGLSWWTGGRSEEASAARIPVLSTPSSPVHGRVTPPVEGEQPPVTPPGVRAIVRIVAPCWVQAVVDGRTLEGKTLGAGTHRSFRADRTLELTLGNPAGARVWMNGRRVQTGPSDQVAHLSYTWRHGRLVGGRV